MYNNSYTHIDHNFDLCPLKQITVDFKQENSHLFLESDYTTITTINESRQFTDPDIINNFLNYHYTNACLRAIHYSANIKHTSGKAVKRIVDLSNNNS